MGVGEVKNCLNHPYVINEWPISTGELVMKYMYNLREFIANDVEIKYEI